MNGKIKRLNERGFGFIETEEGGEDVFFHSTDLQPGVDFNTDLKEGQAVTFDMGQSDKGPKAINVQLVQA